MKRRHILLFFLLLAAAGTIGWFLPTLTVENRDFALEGKAEPITIRQIDLSYQSDRSAEDKLRLIRENSAGGAALERGIFLTDMEARSVLEQFLQELTGSGAEMKISGCVAQPALLSYGAEGSLLVWEVTAVLENECHCAAVLDDQTGLLLRCFFYGRSDWWEILLPDAGSATDAQEYICSALGDALCAHANRRLSVAYTVSVEAEDMHPLGGRGVFLFSENGQVYLQMPFLLDLEQGYIEINVN
jgi:hypothetical protein